MEALRRVLSRADVEGVVVGAIASDYQYTRVGQICEILDLWVYSPLWRKDAVTLLREYVEAGFSVIIVSVSAEGMGERWLGRTLDGQACDEILELGRRYGVHPVGEGGEFETMVLDGPNFSSRLEVLKAEMEWQGTSGTLHLQDVRLVGKPADHAESPA